MKWWSSLLKALLRALRDSLGPKINWVDLWNRSCPSLQCRAPTWPPLLRDFGNPNVPTAPNNTCLHKSGFPLRDLRGCRRQLVPRGLPIATCGRGWEPPGLHLAQLQCTVTITNAPRAWRLGPTALQSHVVPPCLKRSHLCPPDHQLPSLSHELLSAALPEFSNTHPKTDHSHFITWTNKGLPPHGDHMRGRMGEVLHLQQRTKSTSLCVLWCQR